MSLVRVQPLWLRHESSSDGRARIQNTHNHSHIRFLPDSLSWLKHLPYKQKIVGSSPTLGIHSYFNWQNICLGRSWIEDIGSNPIK